LAFGNVPRAAHENFRHMAESDAPCVLLYLKIWQLAKNFSRLVWLYRSKQPTHR
jgi:hypothetical protein